MLYKREQSNIVPVFDGISLLKGLRKLYPLLHIESNDASKIMKFCYIHNICLARSNNRLYIIDKNKGDNPVKQETTLYQILHKMSEHTEYVDVYKKIYSRDKTRIRYANGMKFTEELLMTKQKFVLAYLLRRVRSLTQIIRNMYGVSCYDHDSSTLCNVTGNEIKLIVYLQKNQKIVFSISNEHHCLSGEVWIDIKNEYWSNIKNKILEFISVQTEDDKFER